MVKIVRILLPLLMPLCAMAQEAGSTHVMKHLSIPTFTTDLTRTYNIYEVYVQDDSTAWWLLQHNTWGALTKSSIPVGEEEVPAIILENYRSKARIKNSTKQLLRYNEDGTLSETMVAKQIDDDGVPEEVQLGFTNQFAQERPRWTRNYLTYHKVVEYEANFTDGEGKQHILSYSKSGNLTRQETEIDKRDLPQPALKALKKMGKVHKAYLVSYKDIDARFYSVQLANGSSIHFPQDTF